MKRYRFGVDATTWLQPRGFGRHTRCLLEAVAEIDESHDWVLFVDTPEAARRIPSSMESVLVEVARPTTSAAIAGGRRSVRDVWRMSRALSGERLDALLMMGVYSFVPLTGRTPRAVMIPDATADRFPEMVLENLPARWRWRLKSWLALHQADRVVTISEHSRRDLARSLGLSKSEIDVVGHGSAPSFRVLDEARPTPALAAFDFDPSVPWVAYVGGFNPHKQVDVLLKCFAELKREMPEVRLVLVGETAGGAFFHQFEELQELTGVLGLRDSTVFSGYLEENDLVTLLNLVRVLVLPSLNEGFGLPAVEAAACGCPVIATCESPLPELLAGGGIFVDPRSPEDLSAALREMLSDEEKRKTMGRAAREATATLDWAGPARELIEVMENLAERNRRTS